MRDGAKRARQPVARLEARDGVKRVLQLEAQVRCEFGESSPPIGIELFLCAATSTQMIVSSERGREGTVGGECCPKSSSYPVDPVGFCVKALLARNIWSKAGEYLIVTGNFFESIELIQPKIKEGGDYLIS